ncbi:MAG: energy transducer TonB [Verrucomicrobiota bacterium JB022]|nr:energy transducer TonB [Verrucomicrobiota bacterium JB022]
MEAAPAEKTEPAGKKPAKVDARTIYAAADVTEQPQVEVSPVFRRPPTISVPAEEVLVVLSYAVMDDGRVGPVIIHESNDPAFRGEILLALNRARYKPAKIGDKDVHAWQTKAFAIPANAPFWKDDKEDNPIYELSDDIEKPTMIGHPRITYPIALKNRRITGSVKLKYLINNDGRTGIMVIEHSDHPLFTGAVIFAMRDQRFNPGKKNGKPINVWVDQEFPFDLR